jgi:hypothetical protein
MGIIQHEESRVPQWVQCNWHSTESWKSNAFIHFNPARANRHIDWQTSGKLALGEAITYLSSLSSSVEAGR